MSPGRGAEKEGEADSLLSTEPNVGFNPRPWDHDVSPSQTFNRMRHPCFILLFYFIFYKRLKVYFLGTSLCFLHQPLSTLLVLFKSLFQSWVFNILIIPPDP